MKNTMKRLLCLLLALIMCAGLALGAVATEEGEDDPGKPAITLSETELRLYTGSTSNYKQLDATPENIIGDITISWESSEPSIATVNPLGFVEAVDVGDAIITAKAVVDDEVIASADCKVKVIADTIKIFTVSAVSGAKLENNSITVSGKTSFTLKGTTNYHSGDTVDGANWTITGDEDILSVSGDTFTTLAAGNTQIKACSSEEGAEQYYHIIEVKVEEEPLTGLSISGTGVSGGEVTIKPSASLQLTAAKEPANTFNEDPITWSSSDTSIATVSSSGKVTATKKEGEATITASCGDVNATVTVKVSAASSKSVATITASTTKSENLSFSSIVSTLQSRYKGQYGSNPTSSAKIRFSSLGKSSVGKLYATSSSEANTSTDYTLTKLKDDFTFKPSAAGTYDLEYTLTDSNNSITGTITITVTAAKTKNITITLSDDSPYTFSSSSNSEKYAVTTLIGNAVKDATGSATYSYIIFGSPSTASKNIGTLYANSSKKSLDTYDSYTYKSGTGSIGNLYFVPGHKQGTYSIPYTAYSSGGIELCSGSLKIEVGVDDDGTVTVTLDDDSPYTFSSKTKKGSVSAAKAIDSMIEDEYYESYSYIMFGSVTSGSNVGTLYTDSDRTTFKTSYKYYRTGTSKDYLVSDLYFVPAKAGTYVREFTAYDKYEDEICEGTLKIVVPGDSSSADMDIYFNTTTGSTVSLAEDVFENWFRQEKGSSYKLAYVTFDDASSSYGTFKHGSTSFSPGNDVKYYDEDYTGSTGSNAKYLDSVKFTAPNSTGYVSVDFTCYGGTSASSSGTKASGTFYIYVTKGSVKSVTYDVKYGTAATLKESDFSTVYKNAMSTSSSSSKFYIELLEIPSKGTVYYNYTSSSRPGTKLTSSNFDDYEFYVNSSSSYDSVEDLTYVPANTSGTVSVRYLACDTDGEPLYVGTISFSYGKDQTASISCGSEGYTFKTSDFYSSSDSDPVDYVTFRQPSTGELMLNYTNGRGVSLPSTVRLYTTDYTSGSYTLNSLSYIPKAGFSGDVKVDYTAVTESGSSQNGVLTITVSPKKGSSHFSDVTSTGSGAWASDAIDFAYKWGLVNGTGENTFSPDNTMTRAMLVTILYRSAGSPKVSGSCPFTDVAAGSYYYDAVIWAANGGIVTGTSATTFSPDRNVNREQVAAFLHRYAKYNGENVAVTGTINGYADKAFVSQYAIEPMSWAVQHGYITSTSGEELLLSPGGSATRAQVAVMLHRFLTY